MGSLLIKQDESGDLESQNVFVGRTVLNVGSRTQVGAIKFECEEGAMFRTDIAAKADSQ